MTPATGFAPDVDEYLKRGDLSPKWTPLIKEGLSAFESNNPDMAATFLQRGVEKGCKDGLVYFKLGEYFESRGELQRAKEYFELAEKYLPKKYPKNPMALEVYEKLGSILYTTGDPAGAKKQFLERISKGGNNFTSLFFLGSIARYEGNDQDIINYYTKALAYPPPVEMNPNEIFITVMIEIGKSYYNLGDNENSLAAWSKILERMPDHPIARHYYNLITQKKSHDTVKSEEERMIERLVK